MRDHVDYYMMRLHFTAPVHFGPSTAAQSLAGGEMKFCADTYFSALCHTAMRTVGESLLQSLYIKAKQGELCFTDAMPWKNKQLFLPRPYLQPQPTQAVDPAQRKKWKNIKWLPVSQYSAYLTALQTGQPFETDAAEVKFGQAFSADKVQIKTEEPPEPYSVGLFQFGADCGLYLIIGAKDQQTFEEVRDLTFSLGQGGIGGKVSAGYGSFELKEVGPLNSAEMQGTSQLQQYLTADTATKYITLTTALPNEEELGEAMESASYALVRRSGFVQSATRMRQQKKQEQYFFAAGSAFDHPFKGDIWNVVPGEEHPVYRYGMPMFLRIS